MAATRERFSREQVIKDVSVESVEIEEHEGPEVSLVDVLEMFISNFTALRPSISNFTDFRECSMSTTGMRMGCMVWTDLLCLPS